MFSLELEYNQCELNNFKEGMVCPWRNLVAIVMVFDFPRSLIQQPNTKAH